MATGIKMPKQGQERTCGSDKPLKLVTSGIVVPNGQRDYHVTFLMSFLKQLIDIDMSCVLFSWNLCHHHLLNPF